MNPLTLITDGVGGILGVAQDAVTGLGNTVSSGIGSVYNNMTAPTVADTIGDPTPQPTFMQSLPQMAEVFGASYDAAGGGPGMGRGIAAGLAASKPYWKWRDNIRTIGPPNQVQGVQSVVAEPAQLGPEFVRPSPPDPVELPDWAEDGYGTVQSYDGDIASQMAAYEAGKEAAKADFEEFSDSDINKAYSKLGQDAEQAAASGIPSAVLGVGTGVAGAGAAKILADRFRPTFNQPPVPLNSTYTGPIIEGRRSEFNSAAERQKAATKGTGVKPTGNVNPVDPTPGGIRQLTEGVERRQSPARSGAGAAAQARKQSQQRKDARTRRISMQRVRADNIAARNARGSASKAIKGPLEVLRQRSRVPGAVARVAPIAAGIGALMLPANLEAANTPMGDATIEGALRRERADTVSQIAESILQGNEFSDEEIMMLLQEELGEQHDLGLATSEVKTMVNTALAAYEEQLAQEARNEEALRQAYASGIAF